eukprot:scaffold114813_cov37-Tisochrysis_lutea.AAC.1
MYGNKGWGVREAGADLRSPNGSDYDNQSNGPTSAAALVPVDGRSAHNGIIVEQSGCGDGREDEPEELKVLQQERLAQRAPRALPHRTRLHSPHDASVVAR